MSHAPILVLTRPKAAALRFLEQVEHEVGYPVAHVLSPAIQIRSFGEWPQLSAGIEVILTSEQAVRGDLTDVVTHCVGERTAQAAQENGSIVKTVALDAEDLLRSVDALPDSHAFLHLCGSHKAVDITARLTALGRSCRDIQVYEQAAQPLSEQARSVLEGEEPAVLPLFSPRSARLVGESIAKPGPHLHVIGMSAAIATAWHKATGTSCDVVKEPTGDAMVRGIVAAICD
ncbi:uroporphyrinogen-III synthase [Aliiroseovarius sp. F20344]|uniref:uroporphyrinogen-III synthase n=1 Tax=Aliiroseovarius sp. F20344 TaxID=2926414 RepID=UPI001FF3881A|nr:uroporphyrinogen-III synthase [Aliiroseovarius sp. F20344]MCK0141409.1 uroporphyrinogen-III synthase [Aliiroseovarius sp. F20344]